MLTPISHQAFSTKTVKESATLIAGQTVELLNTDETGLKDTTLVNPAGQEVYEAKIRPVDTIAQLKALPVGHATAFLKDGSRSGDFVWRTGDYTTQITSDPESGFYVKSDYELATVGAWVRSTNGDEIIYAAYFGAKAGTGFGAANSIAIQAALDFAKENDGGEIRLPLGSTVELETPIIVECSALTLSGYGQAGTFNNNDGLGNYGTRLIYTGAGSANPLLPVSVISFGNNNNLYTGVSLENMVVDADYKPNTDCVTFDHGIIDCKIEHARLMKGRKNLVVLGEGLKTSFGNILQDVSIEHFTEIGVDISGDGNETKFKSCKFANSPANTTPQSTVRIGDGESSSAVSFNTCDFGSSNVLHHIEVVEAQSLSINDCTIETSGNSVQNMISAVKLGTATKTIRGFQIEKCRFLGNSKAEWAIQLVNVEAGNIRDCEIQGAWLQDVARIEVGADVLGVDESGNKITTGAAIPIFSSKEGVSSSGVYRGLMTSATNKNYGNDVWTRAAVQAVDYDGAKIANIANDRLSIPSGYGPGTLKIKALLGFAASGNGIREVQIYKNGAALPAPVYIASATPSASSDCYVSLDTGPLDYVGSDFFEVYAKQDSGALLALQTVLFSYEVLV